VIVRQLCLVAFGFVLKGRIKIVLVLVLEKWGWVGELLEYCAKSELHPHSGLEILKERFKIVLESGHAE
jgi:hypothetical protein